MNVLYYSLAFAAAAGMGAYIRLQVNQWVGMPWGTFVVNLLGSLLIGFLVVYLERYSVALRVVILVSFLGALTTFSGYAMDLVRLFDGGQPAKALLYLVSSNVLCFLGCYAGWKIAQKLVITA